MKRYPSLALWAGLIASPFAMAAPEARSLAWEIDGQRFEGALIHDPAQPASAALVLVPNWMGVNASAIEKAMAIASRGYTVLVADVYGAETRPGSVDEASAAAQAMYADRPLLRARVGAAVDQLKAQATAAGFDASRIGAIGFCFGGTTVLELARSGRDDIAGAVSFHGGLGTSLPAQPGQVAVPALVLNGADDPWVSAEEITGFQQEFTAAGADWQFVNFSGAVHCFAEPDASMPPGCAYHERSARRAFRMMDDFFAEAFGG
ncbi:MAG: dienelactone hydrolase family protein [Aquimonas sp.]|nr:dienelactone hydrolase family protein [Aquimonas sp.]